MDQAQQPAGSENSAERPLGTRRTFIRGVAVAGGVLAAGGLAAACGGDDDPAGSADPTTDPTDSAAPGDPSADPSADPTDDPTGDPTDEEGTAANLGPATDVPVGGAMVFAAQKVIVSQPVPGDFKAFSNICTHAGCPIAEIKTDTVRCDCHGSEFFIGDGSVANGPAEAPLESVTVTVKGKNLVLG